MEPFAGPVPEPPTRCADCDSPIPVGSRWRCHACQAAASRAVDELGGQVIRPSDVEARRSTGESK